MTVFFSRPPITLSVASSNYFMLTTLRSVLAAMIAASLQTLAMSAPLKPGVRAEILVA
jgi:hypothetical protein